MSTGDICGIALLVPMVVALWAVVIDMLVDLVRGPR